MNANEHPPPEPPDRRFVLVDGRSRPEFMLVGGMKCGSTSFARYLSAHPQVKLPGPKEPHFWSWHRFPARYQDFFINETPVVSPGPDQCISGEFSTSYLVHPLAPRRIRANLPNLKIFVLLRNPVDRAYSHFMMSKRAGLEPECSFEEIVDCEMEEVPELLEVHERWFSDQGYESAGKYSTADDASIQVAKHEHGFPARRLRDDVDLRGFYYQSYVFRSIYSDQLCRWLRLYPREQIMVIQSERFFEDSPGTMAAAADFLGLQPFDFRSSRRLRRRWDAGAANARQLPEDYAPLGGAVRRTLGNFFEPYNRRLYKLVGEDFEWR